MTGNEPFLIRLTGRPEVERTPWLSTAKIREIGWCHVITTTGIKRCVPTGHFEDGREVWVPEDQRDNWPPHHQRLINILTDNPEEEPNP